MYNSSIGNNSEKVERREEFLKVPYLKDRSISLRQRIILGALLYRERRGESASVNWLAKRTGIDKRFVKANLEKLTSKHLTEKDNAQWRAVRPTDARTYCFSRNEGRFWYEGLLYFSIPLPLNNRALVRHCVLSLLVRLGKQNKYWQSASGLAKMLGASRQSITTALRAMEKDGVLRRTTLYGETMSNGKRRIRGFEFSLPATAERNAILRAGKTKEKKTNKPASKATAANTYGYGEDPLVAQIVHSCRMRGLGSEVALVRQACSKLNCLRVDALRIEYEDNAAFLSALEKEMADAA